MAYIAPIHKPSSIRHALKLQLLAPGEDNLVVAKANRIEIWTQNEDGLALHHSTAVFGKVTMLNKIRPASSSTDHLFVGTDRFHYFTLSWNPDTRQLKTEQSYVDVGERSARASQTGDRTHTDPSGRFLTIEMLEGIITVLPIVQKGNVEKIGSLGDAIPSRIEDLFVRSSAFLQCGLKSEKAKPRLALIYEDSHSKVRLRILELDYTPAGKNDAGSIEFKKSEDSPDGHKLEFGANHLIPIQGPTGGLVILGETSITYYDELRDETTTEPLEEATIFISWCQIDNQRFVLADEYGKLYLLFLELDSNASVQTWKLDVIGETSRASCLVYLDDGHVFVGSHEGDSQVILIRPKGLQVLQTLSNIAPILDFTIMDMGNRSGEGQTNEYSSGQARIVTGSGAWKDGSLRSVRSGVGLQDVGTILEMRNITDLFSLRSHSASDGVDTLIVTTISETRVFRFGADGEIEEVEAFAGISLDQQTLFAGSVQQQRVVQVTPSSVKVSEIESGMTVSEWSPTGDEIITAVSGGTARLLISVGGTEVVLFNVSDGVEVQAQKSFPDLGQIACIDLPSTLSGVALLGFWSNSMVAIVNSSDLSVLRSFSVVDDANVSVPRSILITNIFFDAPPTLFIAMADGNVVTYTVDPSSYEVSGRKSTILGTQQATFKTLPRAQGLYSVFAVCEQPSLIYASEGRLMYSAVTAEKATCVCPFDNAVYPDHIALATNEDLRLAMIDRERTTHVQTLAVNETVRRIAYSPSLKAFGLGTIKRKLVDNAEVVECNFKLVDEIAFNEQTSFPLNKEELIESIMSCELEDGGGGTAERFVVGTAYLESPAQGDATKGRIIVLEVTADRQIKLVAELSIKGACRCLGMSQGRIVAALMKSVAVYSLDHKPGQSPRLTRKGAYTTATAPIDLGVTGNVIAVADLMKSVSLLEHTIERDHDTLLEVGRHFQTVWGTAVANVGENLYLESDAEDNLLMLRRDVDGVTADDKRRLRVEAEMNLGEMVNRMRPVDVASGDGAVVVPRAFMGTVEGSLYMFGLIHPHYVNLLMELQDELARRVQSPGQVPFESWRSYKSQVVQKQTPERFVDGEFVERFLDCSPALQEELVDKVKSITATVDTDFASRDVEWFRELIEGLRRLH